MSAYDVLYDNLPDYFKNVKEFIQILKAHGYALDKLEAAIRAVYFNFFIQTADTTVLSYYERLLGITVSPGDTIAYRRERIMQQISLIPQFDINWLITKLNGLYGMDGYTLEVDSKKCTVDINISSGISNALRIFYDFIWDVLPAHMELSSRQNVTTDIPAGINIGMVASSTVTTTINSPTAYSTDIPVGIYTGMVPSGTKITTIGGISNGNI